MIRILTIILISLLSQNCLSQITKYDDYETTKSEAIIQNKSILIILTGSEWCKPCVKMKKNVFSNPDFVSLLKNNYVIFEINLQRYFDIDSRLYKNYTFFKEKYRSNALPSIIVLDKNENLKKVITKNLTSFDKTYEVLQSLAK